MTGMENFAVFLRYGLAGLLLVCAQAGGVALAASGEGLSTDRKSVV